MPTTILLLALALVAWFLVRHFAARYLRGRLAAGRITFRRARSVLAIATALPLFLLLVYLALRNPATLPILVFVGVGYALIVLAASGGLASLLAALAERRHRPARTDDARRQPP